MNERIIKIDDVEIATQAFGDPTHEPILLIMGAMASMLWWPDEFCQTLTAQKYYVIRYDNRDTGCSTIYEPGEPPYTMDDMAADAIRILDGYGIERANLLGMSLGGTIAQIAALSHPERVKTLTLMSTTPMGIDTSALPHTTDAYMGHAATGETVDWTDDAQVIEFLVEDTRMIAGMAHPYDEGRARAFVERDVERAKNFVSATNHFMLRGGQALKGKLAELAAPLLVIHGTADPIYPVEHGELLARTVKGAKLVRLEGGGHEIHPNDWEEIISAVDAHLR
ncbi:acetyltransferase (plasmid) [Rhizobium leguminosarum bv. trifolii CB782]|uniref:alpha/beta fold hydrolase n=1 Tax=Rhizobium hidalgonense TaxID=1538159 RepID=UPI0003E2F4E1|nr:alpha/beta hydrolase [Rhizobium hidalgonense]AHG48132.1 acetyltransferase [Rhizobium leguminosarum bv. trifolii CB782]QKK26357.1 alpha/beta hydrolase [Rhizobium hidalgonense]